MIDTYTLYADLQGTALSLVDRLKEKIEKMPEEKINYGHMGDMHAIISDLRVIMERFE